MNAMDIRLGYDDTRTWVEVNGQRVEGEWELFRTTTEHPTSQVQILEQEVRVKWTPVRGHDP